MNGASKDLSGILSRGRGSCGAKTRASSLYTLKLAQDFEGFGTATLDGSATSFTVNFIDGTATLSFTPSAVLVSVCGGTQPAAAVVSAIADAITTTGFTCRLSGAGTNTNTLKIAVRVIK